MATAKELIEVLNEPPYMTRKHYEFLTDFATKAHAAVCRGAWDAASQLELHQEQSITHAVMQALAHHLKGTNPNFNYDKFMERVQQKLNAAS